MSINDDRTAETSREGNESEEEGVVRAEAIGGGGGTTEDVDGVAAGVGDGEVRLAAEGGVEEAVGPPSYTNQEVQDMPPGQAIAAVTPGVLKGPQMHGLLGGAFANSQGAYPCSEN
eukprot:CAMPEP_0172603370 /NCGR_PEP_ID=MMETSP1068-20121228/23604_1 /TAXON_ID=35684 /ORGANISM="Pseudopedinella elastica, Strain CCMP716" /LENGTH=115 /DNA_ID=CAMNT_0013405081 /DNA_START=45 /DNA_END=391 /DNA_ORIENTATION=-